MKCRGCGKEFEILDEGVCDDCEWAAQYLTHHWPDGLKLKAEHKSAMQALRFFLEKETEQPVTMRVAAAVYINDMGLLKEFMSKGHSA